MAEERRGEERRGGWYVGQEGQHPIHEEED